MSPRLRAALNLANGSTLLGLAIAAAGGSRPVRGPDRLLLAQGHRLPVRSAFTVGDVVLHPRAGGLTPPLLRHERRHAEQWAWCFGLPFLPLYGLACAVSLLVAGDRATANPFERAAGLSDGGYAGPAAHA